MGELCGRAFISVQWIVCVFNIDSPFGARSVLRNWLLAEQRRRRGSLWAVIALTAACSRERSAVPICSHPFCFPLVERAMRFSRNSVTAFVHFLMFSSRTVLAGI